MGKKYTTTKTDIWFEIDDDRFNLKPVIAASTLFEFANVQSRMAEAASKGGESVADVILDVFSKILDDKSFDIFNARFFGMTPVPIDVKTFIAVTEDILEEITGKDEPEK
jgi:hypothetical protein